ncbi:unnamed protein product, partial [marine sediment metagenome]
LKQIEKASLKGKPFVPGTGKSHFKHPGFIPFPNNHPDVKVLSQWDRPN